MPEQTFPVPDQTTPENPSRRSFHLLVLYFLGGLIAIALAAPTALYLLVPPRFRKPSGFIDAGDISQLTPGVPTEMTFVESGVDGWRPVSKKRTAWVVKQSNNSIVAYGPQCTHLGCAYHYQESQKQFVCPCHASVFGMDGAVAAGPAPRALDRYVSQVRKNRLLLGPLRPASTNKS